MSTVLERPTAGPTTVEDDDLLSRYLRARERLGGSGGSHDQAHDDPRLDDVRTCAHCGDVAPFSFDARDGWAYCSACGRAA